MMTDTATDFFNHLRHKLENLASSSILKRQGDLACINANF
ncbi:hypothetical protein R533_17380 [Salmonella enterica subsp. houtenae serovar 40:z4,z32:-]|nr:hypothetical protein [Salmonella enterica]EBH8336501.1 hypothetical protein [Salmonella enterica subsp. houtenae serovar Houten]ECE6508286.1 hypothetical protein [Salmonella enterica subsp. houtenae]EDO5296700.1 hypothetical protein [Salmonella enterica subsp. houtenae serovar 40:z4,z24:-]OSD42444.1 hypothetical protein R533_17380 [Salmonella enterica subsp. houtenae serovar 40:z4,z32:-]